MQYTYWYAIIEAPADPLVGTPPHWGSGLHDRPLRLVRCGELAAVVSDWPQATVNRSSDSVDAGDVWRHEYVIEHIMHDLPVLPVRFGTVLAGDQRVAAVLGERYSVLKADLWHVGGCVEMGVRVLWQPPAIDPATLPSASAAATPGANYLLGRAAEEKARRATQEAGKRLAAKVGQPLRARAVDVRQTVLPTERMLLNASFLVPVEDVNGFRASVDRLCGEYAGRLSFLCSGPWPPYHFVSA